MDPTRTSRSPRLRALGRAGKLGLAVVLAACCLGYGLIFALGYKPLVMLTGSMGETIPVGSLVVTESVSPSALRVGDMISFEKPIGAHGLDTHRITAIQRSGGHTTYRTKGDANATVDPWMVEFRRGTDANRVALSVPHTGRILLFLRTPLARTLILATIALTLFTTFLKALAANTIAERAERRAWPG